MILVQQSDFNLYAVIRAVRKAKAEVSDSTMGIMTIKAKAATVNDRLVSLKQQISDLVAVVKTNHV